MNLDGRCMVVSGAAHGVVGAGTRLRLAQKGDRVVGRYAGGRIRCGCLVGRVVGARLAFH
jgi:hypothetical protein